MKIVVRGLKRNCGETILVSEQVTTALLSKEAITFTVEPVAIKLSGQYKLTLMLTKSELQDLWGLNQEVSG